LAVAISFTLSELYIKLYKQWTQDLSTNRALRDSDYEKLGGVAGALTRRATEEYDNLVRDFGEESGKAYQATIRRVMLRMVTIEGGGVARRRVLLAELVYPSHEENERVKLAIERLVKARLLVTGQETGESYVEAAHDFLVRGWDKLQTWRKEEQGDLILQRKLNPDAVEWDRIKNQEKQWIVDRKLATIENLNKIPSWLTRLFGRDRHQPERSKESSIQFLWNANPYLDVLDKELKSNDNWLNLIEAKFVRASVLKKSLDTSWRWRIAIGVILGLGGLAGFAGLQSLISMSRELAAKSSLQLTIDPEQSLQLANQAIDRYDTPEAEDALRKSLFESRVRAKIQIPNYQHTNPIWTVAFSSDSKHVVATNMKDGTVKILDIDTLDEHPGSANGKAFTNGDFVLIVSNDGKAEIRNVKTGEKRVLSESLKEITNAVFSPDGKFMFVSRSGKPGQILTVNTGIVTVLSEDLGNVATAIFSSDNQFLVTVNGKAQLWNVSTGSFIRELPGHISKFGDKGEVTVVRFSPDGNYIATACGFGGGCYLAGGSDSNGDGISEFDGTVQIWNKKSGTFEPFKELSTGDDRVYGLAFDPKSQLVATASGDKVARVWDIGSGQSISTFTGHPTWVWSAAFSPDRNLVVTAGSLGGTARVWEATTGKERVVLRGHQDFVVSAVFSPDGRFVLTTGNDGTARIWELNIGKPGQQKDLGIFEPIPEPDSSVQERLRHNSTENWNRAVSSRDRQLVVTFNSQGEQSYATAQVWQADTGTLIRSLDKYKDGLQAAIFSPDRKFIALGEYGNTGKIWEISTGRTVTLIGHESFIYHIAFSPNNVCVATASDDGIVRLWRTTGDPLEIWQGFKGKLGMITFAPDGKSVISKNENNSVRVYAAVGCASTEEIRTLAKSQIEKTARKY
jgi:WD40 repeat protein